MNKLAVFASGAGSNAEKIIEHFRFHPSIEISLVVCNKAGAGVISIAHKNDIPVLMIEKNIFFHGNGYVDELKQAGIDWIILAGFLWKLPVSLVNAFKGRILNIHPALLPLYGGKGMYGSHVHQAVISDLNSESGITIHKVDEFYDNGAIILQAKCPVYPNDTPESLALRVAALEHQHYPATIEKHISEESDNNSVSGS